MKACNDDRGVWKIGVVIASVLFLLLLLYCIIPDNEQKDTETDDDSYYIGGCRGGSHYYYRGGSYLNGSWEWKPDSYYTGRKGDNYCATRIRGSKTIRRGSSRESSMGD